MIFADRAEDIPPAIVTNVDPVDMIAKVGELPDSISKTH